MLPLVGSTSVVTPAVWLWWRWRRSGDGGVQGLAHGALLAAEPPQGPAIYTRQAPHSPGLMSPLPSASSIMLRPMRSCGGSRQARAHQRQTRCHHKRSPVAWCVLLSSANTPLPVPGHPSPLCCTPGQQRPPVNNAHTNLNTTHLDAAAGLHDLQLGGHTRATALCHAVEIHHGRVACKDGRAGKRARGDTSRGSQ